MSYNKEAAINTLVTKGFAPFTNDVEVATKFVEILEKLVSCAPRSDQTNNVMESHYYDFLSGIADDSAIVCQTGNNAIDSVVSLLLNTNDNSGTLEGTFSFISKETLLAVSKVLEALSSNEKDELFAIIEIQGDISVYRSVFMQKSECVKTFAYIDSCLYKDESFVDVVDELLLSTTLEAKVVLHTYDTEAELLVALQAFVNSSSPSPIEVAIP